MFYSTNFSKIMLSIFFISLLVAAYADFSCKDFEGRDVDWFYNQVPPEGEGDLNHFHFDSWMAKHHQLFLILPNINGNDTALFQTLKQFYDLKENEYDQIINIIYNDHHPNKRNPEQVAYGHMKGFLHFHNGQGYLIIHSAPKFGRADFYELPNSATENGQFYFCITIDENALKVIIEHLHITRPSIYSMNIPIHFLNEDIPFLKDFKDGKFARNVEKTIDIFYSASRQMKVDLFSKSKTPHIQLWNRVTQRYPNEKFIIASWFRGNNSYHSTEVLSNVLQTNAQIDNFDMEWSYSMDHSKYAISKSWDGRICLGDLNYAPTQEYRLGGIYCIKERRLARAFKKAFTYRAPADWFYEENKAGVINAFSNMSNFYRTQMPSTTVSFR